MRIKHMSLVHTCLGISLKLEALKTIASERKELLEKALSSCNVALFGNPNDKLSLVNCGIIAHYLALTEQMLSSSSSKKSEPLSRFYQNVESARQYFLRSLEEDGKAYDYFQYGILPLFFFWEMIDHF